jgi:hypothetical protein
VLCLQGGQQIEQQRHGHAAADEDSLAPVRCSRVQQPPRHQGENDRHDQRDDPDGDAPGDRVAVVGIEADKLNAGGSQGGPDRHRQKCGQALCPGLPAPGQELGGGESEKAAAARGNGGADKGDPERKVLHGRDRAGDPAAEHLSRDEIGDGKQGYCRQHRRGKDILETVKEGCGFGKPRNRRTIAVPIAPAHLVATPLCLLVLGAQSQHLVEQLGMAGTGAQHWIGRFRLAAPQGKRIGVKRDDVQATHTHLGNRLLPDPDLGQATPDMARMDSRSASWCRAGISCQVRLLITTALLTGAQRRSVI